MRVLITNLCVAQYSGSEMVVELLADGLRREGHAPMLLAPMLGPQADKLRDRGHVVVDRTAALPFRPDIIHAQHKTAALSAFAAFPDVPAVFSCHSALFEVEAPRPHPQIRRWIAVDHLCRDRCLSRGVPGDKLTIIRNAVDLDRFARRPPLPEKPRRALLLTKNSGHHAAVREACARHGVELDALGSGVGRVSDQIERELPRYDLVFATARMALEAAATGCAVVVCDGRGFAGLLTADRLDAWRDLNFGAGLLSRPTTPVLLSEAIAGYDALDAAAVADRLRAEASLERCVQEHLVVYAAALADPAATPAACAAATADWIEELTPTAPGREWDVIAREIFQLENARLEGLEQRLTAAIHDSAQRLDWDIREFTAQLEAERKRRDWLGRLRSFWRARVPHAVRAPLHRLRTWALGR